MLGNIDEMMNNIKKRIVSPIIIFVLFVTLTHRKVNDILVVDSKKILKLT